MIVFNQKVDWVVDHLVFKNFTKIPAKVDIYLKSSICIFKLLWKPKPGIQSNYIFNYIGSESSYF